MRTKLRRFTVLGVVVGAGGVIGALAFAGDLDPPKGPVAPTMRTLDEVFTAASSGGGGGGTNSACVPGLYGALGLPGTCAIPGLQSGPPGGTFEVFKCSQEATRNPPPAGGGGGGVGGPTVINEFVLTKPVDATSVGIFRAVTQGTAFATATVTLVDAGGAAVTTVTLKNCYIVGRTLSMVYRCDGSTVMAEDVRISSPLVRYTDVASGKYWEFNTGTGVGSGN